MASYICASDKLESCILKKIQTNIFTRSFKVRSYTYTVDSVDLDDDSSSLWTGRSTVRTVDGRKDPKQLGSFRRPSLQSSKSNHTLT